MERPQRSNAPRESLSGMHRRKSGVACYGVITMRCLLMILLLAAESGSDCPNVRTELSGIRKRRHLTFPEGTNFAVTISLVKAFMTHAPSGWNSVIEIDVTFPMPGANFTNAYYRRKLHHRQKRQIWEKLQSALELHNLNGEACIVRSICEAKTHLAPPGKSLVHDLLRVVFTAPLHEGGFAEEMGGGYAALLDPAVCDKVNDCPISLLHFVLALNKQKY